MGFGIPTSGAWATPGNVKEIAQTAEKLGYQSVWTFQRLLFPAGDPIPEPYRSVLDPIALASYVAAVTERIRIGIAIVNLPYYTPALLAKMLTTVDVVSDGRLDAGLGLGWNADEFQSVGVPMAARGKRAEEFLRCLHAIWTEDPVEFHGEFYDVPASHIAPPPVQRPHPPLLLGASADVALRRIGAMADGWISSSRYPGAQVPNAIDTIRNAATDAGRDPDTLRYIVRGSVRVRDNNDDDDAPLTGTIDKIRRDIETYASYGVTELFVDLNFDEQIGTPDADAAESMRRAHEALEAFYPGS